MRRSPNACAIHGSTSARSREEVGAHPGGRWTGGSRRGEERGPGGEFAFEWHDRWRVATGDIADPVEAPFAGIVRDVRPGVGITIRAAGRGIRGIVALGGPTRGRLQTGTDGELRSGGLDVGSAGTILVVGSRVDAETLTRARAMGVCGVVVAGLSSKERRDFLASEARQRAALHRLPSFAVLVLDGASRRPLAGADPGRPGGPGRSRGRHRDDPPMLVFDMPNLVIPDPPVDLVRIRAGALAGREGRFIAAIGPRRFAGGVHLEAGSSDSRRDRRRHPARRPRAVRLSAIARRPADRGRPSATLGRP